MRHSSLEGQRRLEVISCQIFRSLAFAAAPRPRMRTTEDYLRERAAEEKDS